MGTAALSVLSQPPHVSADRPSLGMVLGAGLLGLVLAAVFWPITAIAVVIAHEGGHAVTASLMGGSVTSIHVHRAGGATLFRGVGPVGTFVVALAGYLGPSVFGVLGAFLLTGGYIAAVLWLSLVFLALALLQAADLFTGAFVLLTGAVIVAILRYASTGQQTFFAYTWIWVLLIGGFVNVLVLQHLRGRGGDTSSDAYVLRKLTFLPASLWSGVFWLGTLAALVYGAGILLGMVHIGR